MSTDPDRLALALEKIVARKDIIHSEVKVEGFAARRSSPTALRILRSVALGGDVSEGAKEEAPKEEAEAKAEAAAAAAKKEPSESIVLAELLRNLPSDLPLDKLKAILHPLRQVGETLYLNANTRSRFYSEFRTMLTLKFPRSEEYLTEIRKATSLDYESHQKLVQAAQHRVIQTNTEGLMFEAVTVFNVIRKLNESPMWAERGVAVALACGARSIEILKISEFRPVPKGEDEGAAEGAKGENWIIQIGIAKDKEQKKRKEAAATAAAEGLSALDIPREVKKPLLVLTPAQLIASIAFIREQSSLDGKGWAHTPNTEVNSKTHYQLNRAIQHAFGRSDISFHRITRALYGRITFDTFHHDPGLSLTAWVSSVLGHQIGSLQSALNYQAVTVVYPLPATSPNLDHRLTDMQSKLELIQEEMRKVKHRPLPWERDRYQVPVRVETTDGKQKTVIMPRHRVTRRFRSDAAVEAYVRENFEAHGFLPSMKALTSVGFSSGTVNKYFDTHHWIESSIHRPRIKRARKQPPSKP